MRVIVAVMIGAMVVMVVMVTVRVAMRVIVPVGMVMIVVMDALNRPAALRVLAEHERLDRHRHGIRRHPDAPEVDVVEVAQHHAVDAEDAVGFAGERLGARLGLLSAQEVLALPIRAGAA